VFDESLNALLEDTMSVSRLLKTGLFKKIEPPSEEVRPHLQLQLAILEKALLDQFDKHEQYRIQSKLWARLQNPDFVEVCEHAFLDPEDVLEVFKQVTRIFRNNGEDLFYIEDREKISKLTKKEWDYYLYYEDPEIPLTSKRGK